MSDYPPTPHSTPRQPSPPTSQPTPRPQRVRVTGPPRRSRAPLTRAADIDAGTRLGEVYLASLLRAQLWLGVRVLLLLVAGVGSLPLLFLLLPALGRVAVLGIPLPWLVLGVAVYPYLYLLGHYYVRRAEQNEAAFADLLSQRSTEPSP